MHRLFAVLLFACALVGAAFAQAAPFQTQVGKTATLTASADGTPPFTITWKKDGVALPVTGAVLTLTNLKLTDAGTYTATISNVGAGPGGGTVSVDQVFTLVILPASNGKIAVTST